MEQQGRSFPASVRTAARRPRSARTATRSSAKRKKGEAFGLRWLTCTEEDDRLPKRWFSSWWLGAAESSRRLTCFAALILGS
jgi:hypothetical protein